MIAIIIFTLIKRMNLNHEWTAEIFIILVLVDNFSVSGENTCAFIACHTLVK